jgi:uncharacterized cupin superfamily protein
MMQTSHPSLRLVDFAAFQALAADQRYTQKLLDRTSGGDRVAVSLIRTPAGKGSPEGLHTHDLEQIFYVLSGEMNIEIDSEVFVRLPGAWSAFPRECRTGTGMTRGAQDTLHLAVNGPAPQLGQKAAKPVR